MSESGGRSVGLIIVVIALIVGVIAIPIAIAVANKSPEDWLDKNYTKVNGTDPKYGTVTYTSDDSFDTTVNKIVEGTKPDDERTVEGDTTDAEAATADPSTSVSPTGTYLRYDSNWLVRIFEDSTTGEVRIELDEFDRGYNRYGGSRSTFVGVWGGHYGRSSSGGGLFRGGGSGFGK